METFLSICRENRGWKGKKEKKIRRYLIRFALNFNGQLKEFMEHETAGRGTSGQFMRTQIDYDGQTENQKR